MGQVAHRQVAQLRPPAPGSQGGMPNTGQPAGDQWQQQQALAYPGGIQQGGMSGGLYQGQGYSNYYNAGYGPIWAPQEEFLSHGTIPSRFPMVRELARESHGSKIGFMCWCLIVPLPVYPEPNVTLHPSHSYLGAQQCIKLHVGSSSVCPAAKHRNGYTWLPWAATGHAPPAEPGRCRRHGEYTFGKRCCSAGYMPLRKLL